MEGVVEGGRNRRGYNIKEWRGGTGTPLGGVSILQGGMEGPALHRYPWGHGYVGFTTGNGG